MTPLGLLRTLRPQGGSFSAEVVESFAANMTVAGLNVLSGVLLARYLGAQGRGELLAIQALPMIVGSIGMLGLQDSIIYFGARDRARVGEYAISATSLIVLLGLPIVALSAWLMPLYLSSHSDELILLSRIYLGLLFVNAVHGVSIFSSRAVHDIRRWNALRVVVPLLWAILIVLLARTGLASAGRLAMSYLLAYFAWSFISLLTVRRYLRRQWRPRAEHWKPMLKYGLPLAAGGAPQVLNERLDQLIIAGMLPLDQAGQYAVATSWAMLMMLPATALFAVAFSRIAAMQDAVEQWRFIRKTSWALCGVGLVSGVVLCVAAPWIIPLVFKEEFRPAVPLAMILVLAVGLRSLARMFQAALMGVGRSSGVMIAEWAGLIVLGLGIALLLPALGVAGAAWAAVLASAAAASVALISLRRWAAAIAGG